MQSTNEILLMRKLVYRASARRNELLGMSPRPTRPRFTAAFVGFLQTETAARVVFYFAVGSAIGVVAMMFS